LTVNRFAAHTCRLGNVPQYYAQTALQSLSVQAFVKERLQTTYKAHDTKAVQNE